MGAELGKVHVTSSSYLVCHEFVARDATDMPEHIDRARIEEYTATPSGSNTLGLSVIEDASVMVPSCGHQTGCRAPGAWTSKELDAASSWPHQRGPNLMMLLESVQPVFGEIVSYVASSPSHFVRLCALASRSLAVAIDFEFHPCWAMMYSERWPAFYQHLRYHGAVAWRAKYQETFRGHLECVLEVFDREKKLGFAMAAMPAHIQYDAKLNSYVARYLSASTVMPEVISSGEEHRLRFCPTSAQTRLMPASPFSECGGGAELKQAKRTKDESYPYKVLEGVNGLTIGQGVELQWRMQKGSPFGWWYGELESLKMDADGVMATAVIIFRHFPANSRWYRLQVRFGGPEMLDCPFGGYTGGVRPVSDKEHKHWMRFFPKKPVTF